MVADSPQIKTPERIAPATDRTSSGSDAGAKPDFSPYIGASKDSRIAAAKPEIPHPTGITAPETAKMLGKFELSTSSSQGDGAKANPPYTEVIGQNSDKREYQDGSSYIRTTRADGKVENVGKGNDSSQQYKVIDQPDGTYKVLDAQGKPVERSTNPEIVASRNKLDELSKAFKDPEQRAKFHADMAKLEERLAGKPGEVAKTFETVAGMLEQKDNAKVKPELVDHLARDVMSQSASPSSTDQGHHNTCTVNPIGNIIFHDNPSIAAQAIKDLALTGEHKMTNGEVIKLDEHSLTPDKESSQTHRLDGSRSLASQYLDVLMTNAVHAERKDGLIYRNHETEGEQLIQTGDAKNPSQVIGNDPTVSEEGRVRAYRLMTGDQGKKIVLLMHESQAATDAQGRPKQSDGIALYKTKEEYDQLLKKMQSEGNFPVLSTIDVTNDFNPGKKDVCRVGQDGSTTHGLAIDGYIKGNVLIDNQWSSKCDYPLPLSKAFDASVDPMYALKSRIEAADKGNKFDGSAEVGLLSHEFRNAPEGWGYDAKSASALQNIESVMKKADGKGAVFDAPATKQLVDFAMKYLSNGDRAKLADEMRASHALRDQNAAINEIGDLS